MENDPNLFRRMLDSEKFIIIGKMASAVAHEINNPIMIISNLTSLILDDADQNPIIIKPGSEEYNNLKEILNECHRISKITKSLFEFSRTSSAKPTPQDIETNVIEALKLMESLLVKAQINVKMNIRSKQGKCHLRGNEIQQVLVHIFDNSLHALREKYGNNPCMPNERYIEITLRNETIIKDNLKMNYAVLDIYDDGIGIPEKIQQKIFTPFFTTKKAKAHEAEKGQGLGLGLTFSKTIIEDHGGFIKFESEERKFTQFHIYLPLIDDFISDPSLEVIF